MLRVGLIGWRGMVGSILLQRMRVENDFKESSRFLFHIRWSASCTVRYGHQAENAKDLKLLASRNVLIGCQGGGYTVDTYGPLRKSGWKGFWVMRPPAFAWTTML